MFVVWYENEKSGRILVAAGSPQVSASVLFGVGRKKEKKHFYYTSETKINIEELTDRYIISNAE